jgi:SAM-dependent methyltransferase
MAQFVVDFAKLGQPASADGRLDAPAFHRNYEPIWSAIGRFLAAAEGDLLEIGSGTGQHAVTYAARAPALTWWPSDIYDSHLASIEAWRAYSRLENVRPPRRLDLTDADWTARAPNALTVMVSFNVLHIAPFSVAEHLFAGAGRLLKPDGRLFLYGPFKRGGAHTAPSNEAFDAKLRAENPAWGVRDIDELDALARAAGLSPAEATPMPANNFTLAFTRQP